MRILALSDLHMEFSSFAVPSGLDFDTVILAGDIHVLDEGTKWATQTAAAIKKPVIYVPGNHEYYNRIGRSVGAIDAEMKRTATASNTYLLNPGVVEINEWRFLGCTLWSDFDYHGRKRRRTAMDNAKRGINDFRLIWLEQPDGTTRQFTPEDARRRHLEERAWLCDEIRKGDPSKTVVITHFGPTRHAVASEFKDSLLTPAFVSDMDLEIRGSGVPLWVFGHTHRPCDVVIGRTRVVSNQRGYPNEHEAKFDPRWVIEV